MLYISQIISILEVLIVVVPALLVVAFVTIAERKTMASMQRRIGPNIVGYYGLLQAFADALKLLLKEYISPTQANLFLFFLGPIITLVFSLLGYAVIPYGAGSTLLDFHLGILFMLAVSSLSSYGILLAGWSANSKYAFLGSLRSTAQLISYELILSSAILLVILFTSSLNLTVNIEMQKAIWWIVPLFPVFYIFFIGAIAETNRAPFDLAEAESELVSGFMTEHSAVIFVFFFLAEYASIVLICILIAMLYLGGYTIDYYYINYILEFSIYTILDPILLLVDFIFSISLLNTDITSFSNDYLNIQQNYATDILYDYILYTPSSRYIFSSLVLGIKIFILIYIFIWVRASFPRIRFDQLMSYCWTVLLPLIFAFVIFIPCVLYVFYMVPTNVLMY